MDRPAVEAPLLDELEVEADAVGEEARAAADHDGDDDRPDLVDQPGRERRAGEPGPVDGEVAVLA